MRTPRSKDHVAGTWQVAIFVRSPDGDSFEFCSKKPLGNDDPPVLQARRAVAAIMGLKPDGPDDGGSTRREATVERCRHCGLEWTCPDCDGRPVP